MSDLTLPFLGHVPAFPVWKMLSYGLSLGAVYTPLGLRENGNHKSVRIFDNLNLLAVRRE